jgi:hypothetical protein
VKPRPASRGYWFPICESCDDDAVSVRLSGSSWWFYCTRHSQVGDITVKDVRRGWRPPGEDSHWNAALTAIQGVRKAVADSPTVRHLERVTTHTPTAAPFVAPRPRVAAPVGMPVYVEPDDLDVPLPDEPPEEEWR